MVSKIEGCILPGFEVTFAKVEEPKVDFFLMKPVVPLVSACERELAR